MFASAFVSNFNIVSMVMLTLTQRMGTEPNLCVCIFVTIASTIFENANANTDVQCEWAFRDRATMVNKYLNFAYKLPVLTTYSTA